MTDDVGCSTTMFASVSEPPPLVTTYTTLYGCSTCTTIGNASGGFPPYTYLWCDGSITPQLFFCGPGACIVVVVDANGCQITDTILLNPPPPLGLMTSSTGTSCNGCSDGSITGTGFGGIPAYIYNLYPAGTSNATGIFNNLPAGTYQLCVTDVNNCTTCDSVVVLNNPNGISTAISKGIVRIFPNPFSAETTLEINHELLKLNPELLILDLLGNEVSSFSISHLRSTIERKNLTAGIYFYQIKASGKPIGYGKLIITD